MHVCQVLDLVDTVSSDAAMRGVSREEMNTFYGAHFRAHVSDSLTNARENYEHRAANGSLSTAAEAPVFQDLVRSKTLFQVRSHGALPAHSSPSCLYIIIPSAAASSLVPSLES